MEDRLAQLRQMISIVIPVYNEAENIKPTLESLQREISADHETILVYDFDEDTTVPVALAYQASYPSLRLVKNTRGRGVVNALKTGVAAAGGDVVVVTMADLSDDVTQIDEMAALIRHGNAVVAGSRYMRGGGQNGGPLMKKTLSRIAGMSLHWMAGVGTRDATNNFKAYDNAFLRTFEIESTAGFEIGLEITTRAHLAGRNVTEIPTIWNDRTAGESRFKVLSWLPSYLRWYLRCLWGTWVGRRRRALHSAPTLSTSALDRSGV